MRTATKLAVTLLVVFPALRVAADESQAVQPRASSRGVYAYYDAAQAPAVARDTGKPIFVISVRGNDCAGGL